MIVNPDVDSKTKTLNHRKIIRKTHKNNNLLKTKGMLKPKYKLDGRSVFTFSLPRVNIVPVKVASGFFYCWSLLQNNNTATNLKRFTLCYGGRRFVA